MGTASHAKNCRAFGRCVAGGVGAAGGGGVVDGVVPVEARPSRDDARPTTMAAMTAAPASRCVDGNSFESVEYILAPRSWSLCVCV